LRRGCVEGGCVLVEGVSEERGVMEAKKCPAL
jgi:hypothetical protein